MAAIQKGQYFLKDKKAQIYKHHKGGQDPEGFSIGDYYTPIAPAALWCYAKQLSQEQLYAAHAYWNDETRLFVFNFRDDIKQYDTLHYIDKNEWYEVTRVDTTDDYNGELFVYVKNLKWGIKEEDIEPYGYEPDTE